LGTVELLTNRESEVHIFSATPPVWPPTCPNDLPDAHSCHRPGSNGKVGRLTTEELVYVAWLSTKIDRAELPDKETFDNNVKASNNRREKFSLLKHIKELEFCDLIGEVVRVYQDPGGERVTLYFTDYTRNELFHDYKDPRKVSHIASRDGDEYGYSGNTHKAKPENEWPGPFGKLTIQITAWEPHATFIRENVRIGAFLSLKNVQIKAGNGLEGKLRTDRKYPTRLYVSELKVDEDNLDHVDQTRLRDMRKRKYAYIKAIKILQQQWEKEHSDAMSANKENEGDASAGGTIKKQLNAKQRRKEERAVAQVKRIREEHPELIPEMITKVEQGTTTTTSAKPKAVDRFGLNEHVQAFKPQKASIPLSVAIVPPQPQKLSSVLKRPDFQARLFRTDVRVVGYMPHNIADFAVGRKCSGFEDMSDYETDEDDMPSSFEAAGALDGFVGTKDAAMKWKWQFMLKLEDASPLRVTDDNRRDNRTCVWVTVDDAAGQYLLNSLDATNLRRNKEAKETLMDKLFILWGDLADRKMKFLMSDEGRALLERAQAVNESSQVDDDDGEPASSAIEVPQSSPLVGQNKRADRFGAMPADSDDEDAEAPLRKAKRARTAQPQNATPTSAQPPPMETGEDRNKAASSQLTIAELKSLPPSQAQLLLAERLADIGQQAQNRPFTACIKEIGIPTAAPVEDDEPVDSGVEGGGQAAEQRFQRHWMLHRTTIKA
jgi:hypothetical protein